MPPQESTESPGKCPEDVDGRYGDYTYTWRPFKGHCYVFITDEIEWRDASVNCIRHGKTLLSNFSDGSFHTFDALNIALFTLRTCIFCCLGGNLASIEDTDEQQFLQKSLQTFNESHVSFWIGLFKTRKGTVQLHFDKKNKKSQLHL